MFYLALEILYEEAKHKQPVCTNLAFSPKSPDVFNWLHLAVFFLIILSVIPGFLQAFIPIWLKLHVFSKCFSEMGTHKRTLRLGWLFKMLWMYFFQESPASLLIMDWPSFDSNGAASQLQHCARELPQGGIRSSRVACGSIWWVMSFLEWEVNWP